MIVKRTAQGYNKIPVLPKWDILSNSVIGWIRLNCGSSAYPFLRDD